MTTIKTVTEASPEGWLKILVPDSLRGLRLEVVAQIQPEIPGSAAGHGDRPARLRDVMERIAQRGGIASIPDPAIWQREIRADRPLPGRAE